MDKNCDNCINSGRPSYEWPCTDCTTAYGSAPSKWESIVAKDTNVPSWIPVSERLPEEKTYVLISCGGNVHVARIEMGIDERIRDAMKRGELSDPLIPSWSASTGYTWVKRSMLYSGCDVHGNNLVPYCWYSNYGPGKWFGQEVSHWMLLPEPPKEDV